MNIHVDYHTIVKMTSLKMVLDPLDAELLKSIAEKFMVGFFSRAAGTFFQTYMRIRRLFFSVFVIFMS